MLLLNIIINNLGLVVLLTSERWLQILHVLVSNDRVVGWQGDGGLLYVAAIVLALLGEVVGRLIILFT